MKKLITALCLFLLLPVVVAVAGCNNLNEGDDWKEVQSITYTTDKGTTTLTSECKWDTTDIRIEQSEYDNAPEEQKRYGSGLPNTEVISVDRISFINNANTIVGNTYYYSPNKPYYDVQLPCYIVTVNTYTLTYIKIRFTNDKGIEFYEDDNTVTKVYPISYKVTYFEN